MSSVRGAESSSDDGLLLLQRAEGEASFFAGGKNEPECSARRRSVVMQADESLNRAGRVSAFGRS